MKTRRMRNLLLGLSASALAFAWATAATAAVIPSVSTSSPYAPNRLSSGSYTISIYQLDSTLPATLPAANAANSCYSATPLQKYQDVTGCWLPAIKVDPTTRVVTGSPVYVVINQQNSSGVAVPQDLTAIGGSLALVDTNPASPAFSASTGNTTNPFLNSTTLTTSHYRGTCTNFGPNTDTSADYIFDPVNKTPLTTTSGAIVNGYKLTPTDCGGMAVIKLTVGKSTFTFIVPGDANGNGIPDNYEARFPMPTSCKVAGTTVTLTVNGTDDKDCTPTPALTGLVGDGFANFDEARGFLVSNVQIRTDWRQKDVFVHFVNPQCLPNGQNLTASDFLNSTASLLGGGLTSFLPPDGTTVIADVNNIVSAAQVHLLGYRAGGTNYTTDEWIDNFQSLTVVPPVAPSTTPTYLFNYLAGTDSTTSDRQVNLNALYAIRDANTLKTYQKGLRISECIDLNDGTIFGNAGWGSANGPDNSIIFSRVIANSITGLIANVPSLAVQYVTYQGAPPTATAPQRSYTFVDPATGAQTTKLIDSVYIAAKAIQYYIAMEIGHSIRLNTTNDSKYGYHLTPGTGDNMDQAFINKQDPTALTNTFYVPSQYGSADQLNFRVRN